jgi:predicted glycoside hydrolase/deacetylase ChbG (UPF0249 family)
MRRLIINADDYGLSDGICRAIHQLIDAGAVSSTTMMLAAEGAIARCRKWNVGQLVGKVGVHLQVTDGRPILPRAQISGLINQRTGKFRSKSELAGLDPSDVEKEWRAQIEVAHELLKDKPSHLDSHHGANHVPSLVDVFIKLACEFDLPIRDCTAMHEYRPDLMLRGSQIVLYEWTARRLNAVDLQNQIRKALSDSRDDDILEVVTHPGYSDADLRSISTLNDLREADFTSLLDLMNAHWLKQERIQLISFHEIHR